eukprot:TRINITY_DN562_c0_g1_i2.p3 TRINITY_DN562_c0_g1~~TRINITY_DN562_c0_g1_i2.p3  ORF type:complete len:102 (+),score=25.53 TRINITY_DN562_c0_g1_i2:197-502(+)
MCIRDSINAEYMGTSPDQGIKDKYATLRTQTSNYQTQQNPTTSLFDDEDEEQKNKKNDKFNIENMLKRDTEIKESENKVMKPSVLFDTCLLYTSPSPRDQA